MLHHTYQTLTHRRRDRDLCVSDVLQPSVAMQSARVSGAGMLGAPRKEKQEEPRTRTICHAAVTHRPGVRIPHRRLASDIAVVGDVACCGDGCVQCVRPPNVETPGGKGGGFSRSLAPRRRVVRRTTRAQPIEHSLRRESLRSVGTRKQEKKGRARARVASSGVWMMSALVCTCSCSWSRGGVKLAHQREASVTQPGPQTLHTCVPSVPDRAS